MLSSIPISSSQKLSKLDEPDMWDTAGEVVSLGAPFIWPCATSKQKKKKKLSKLPLLEK